MEKVFFAQNLYVYDFRELSEAVTHEGTVKQTINTLQL